MKKAMRSLKLLFSPEDSIHSTPRPSACECTERAEAKFELLKSIIWIAVSITVSLLLARLH